MPAAALPLDAWRARLLDRLLKVVIVAGWLVGIPSVLLAMVEGLWPLVIADSLTILWLTALYRLRGVSHQARALQFLALLYLLSVTLLVMIGHVSQIYLMALPIMAVLLVSLRVAVGCLILNGITLFALGFLLSADTGMTGVTEYPMLRWGAITLNFLLIDTALTIACAFLLRGMESALAEQQVNADRLQHQALHDALTGLANRRLLHDRIEQAISHARRTQRLAAVVLLDLDRFKNVNDSHGHDLGDELIVATAKRLQATVRGEDTVARLGGDEFVVLLSDATDEAELASAVERVQAGIVGVYNLSEHQLHVTSSIGVSVFPRDGEDVATLLKNADTAMYRAKEGGRNRFQFYLSEMNERLSQRLELEMQLRGALERSELCLHYQPRVRCRDGVLLGAEALLRWHHPTLGLISPAQFIPIAEESGLIVPIGEWVLQTACAQAMLWQAKHPHFCMSINLSPRQFRHKGLLDSIAKALAAQPLTKGSIEIEVTESLVMHNLEAAQTLMHTLRGMHLSIAMDDFGTGFSSLAYLKAFPLDVLKIDQSFVRGLEDDPRDVAIVKTVVDLAANLGMETVAEGVETEAQATLLRSLGVDQWQGYLIARPLPADEFAAWMDSAEPVALATA